jgi:hypothetical protein
MEVEEKRRGRGWDDQTPEEMGGGGGGGAPSHSDTNRGFPFGLFTLFTLFTRDSLFLTGGPSSPLF